MRVFLKQPQKVGPVHYPCSGFYNNVDDALAKDWIDEGLAHAATEQNEIIETPAPEAAPSAPVVEAAPPAVESVSEHDTTT